VAKKMVASGCGGSIVNISSKASQVALKDHTVYCKYFRHSNVYRKLSRKYLSDAGTSVKSVIDL
jgi:NADP-dependent 3-hydroxy acid dehydrogenase YdfG